MGTLTGSRKKGIGGLTNFGAAAPTVCYLLTPPRWILVETASSRPRGSCWAGSRPPEATRPQLMGLWRGGQKFAQKPVVLKVHCAIFFNER